MFLISNLRRMRSLELGVGADLVADRGEAGGQLGLGRGEALGRVRRAAVSIVVPEGSTNVSERSVR